ncbi:ATP-binding protein [Rhizobium sp. RAF56]|uniref:ATP-binding protein n=1 Tax=Rhizobium sp. RAF56 TaxID=3233062 RepID=UPI003F9DC250
MTRASESFNVFGTELFAADTRETARQKLARITFDSMAQFVGLLDTRGNVIEINRVALETAGTALSEIEGKPFWTTFWWQASEEMREALRTKIQSAASGDRMRWDAKIRGHADGDMVAIEATLMPLKDERGRVRFITFEARDLTAGRAEEREIGRPDGEGTTSSQVQTRAEHTRLIREEARVLEILNRVGMTVSAELNLDRAVQVVTDAATEITGAAFGSFFYNVLDEQGESYMLYALSGVPREAFSRFPMPRNTAVFAPTFKGEGVVRSDDILEDPRYGKHAPYYGMPKGHLPVRSYLAAPVLSRSGEVLGGLFLGHPEPGVFTAAAERLVTGIAVQAAIAIDNARLFQAAEREVAERRRAEVALQQLNATLGERVAEEVRERAKAEDQLRQVQKMEAVGQLTGGIAHDFNNMLAVIVGGLNLLQRKLAKGDMDVGRFIEGALEGAQRASALTKRLLAFSRQQTLEPEPIDLNGMVLGTRDLLMRTLGEHVHIKTALEVDLWQVKVDPGQIENTILNLAVNARDAMPDGGALTIGTSNLGLDDRQAAEFAISPGPYVLLVVADTGFGMAPDVIAKAFEPFFTTKEVGKGTGLGLSQVYGFVRQSGGHVQIESQPGSGTAVRIYLPRHEGAAQKAGITGADCHGLPGEVVMVVEDEAQVRAISVEALKELGYGVIEAAGPGEALRLLEQGQPVSLLFTDVVMPDMSGRELADRARDRLPGLKVLYTSGYARNAILRNGSIEPGTSLLSKPFSVDDLALKVRQALDR